MNIQFKLGCVLLVVVRFRAALRKDDRPNVVHNPRNLKALVMDAGRDS